MRKRTHEQFMAELLEKQPDIHDRYIFLSEYITINHGIKVRCRLCGIEVEKKPSRMLQGNSCKGCAMWTIPEVEAALKESQPTFTFEKITNPHNKALITATCENGHVMVRQMGRFLRNRGCRECSFERARTHGDRIPEALAKHPDLNFISVTGNGHEDHITLECPHHGVFTKPLRGFIKGQGCQVCAKSQLSPQSLTLAKRRKEDWINVPCDFYILSVKSRDKSFYKYGISKDIKGRLSAIRRGITSDYEVSVCYTIPTNKYVAVMLEQEMDVFIAVQDIPKFAGYTETFEAEYDLASDLIEYLLSVESRYRNNQTEQSPE